ncbi:hypothetical protein AB0E69_25400 [Kribbella sp. NPDC026611]|uniref:hypothetical protein n=1 Tax=Kribbella sp. NPDC026611 TaxID=3154911 RepID=UPI0033E1DD89
MIHAARSRRRVLYDVPLRGDFAEYAEARRWTSLDESSWKITADATLVYSEHATNGICFVYVVAPDPTTAEDLADQVDQDFQGLIRPPDELRDRVLAADPTGQGRDIERPGYTDHRFSELTTALIMLGLGAPLEPREEDVGTLLLYAGHESRIVRTATVEALAATGWILETARRVVLRSGVSRDEIERAAAELDWVPRQNGELDTWSTSDLETSIRHVTTHPTGLPYLIVQGPDAVLIEYQALGLLGSWSLAEALTALAVAPPGPDRRTALLRVALAAPRTPHPNVEGDFVLTAADADPATRRAVVDAVGYLRWPSLLALVERLRTTDPDPTVRAAAAAFRRDTL